MALNQLLRLLKSNTVTSINGYLAIMNETLSENFNF